jgi:hypothetical protein
MLNEFAPFKTGRGDNIVTSGKYRKKGGARKHFPLDKRGRDAVF